MIKKLQKSNDNWALVEKRDWHAWVEKNGQVIDKTINLILPIKQYYQSLQARPVKKYKDLSWIGLHLAPKNHWGPW